MKNKVLEILATIYVAAVILMFSDLSPLWLWKSYLSWLNNLTHSYPRFSFCAMVIALVFSAMMSGSLEGKRKKNITTEI
ncbi:MAG: hypothetical protein AAB678_02120 [Patescibacteria group bacterium]